MHGSSRQRTAVVVRTSQQVCSLDETATEIFRVVCGGGYLYVSNHQHIQLLCLHVCFTSVTLVMFYQLVSV